MELGWGHLSLPLNLLLQTNPLPGATSAQALCPMGATRQAGLSFPVAVS